jgi:glucose/arabinose dehydrogenase
MGIALSPNFDRDGYVFVVGTFLDAGRLVNRVIRFTEQSGRGSDPRVLIDDIPAAEFHAGGAIAFGPDGMFYVAAGDAGNPGNARERGSLSGKILRYAPDGSIPADNPFPGSPVYALGLRNVQGMAWTADGEMFATDHGPSGIPNERLRRNHDELNRIVRGGNYGWPSEAGSSSDPAFVAPLVDWTPAIAPAGLAIYTGEFEPWLGSAFVSGLRGRQLRRIRLDRAPAGSGDWRVSGEEVLFDEQLGRIRAVTMGPDGFIYFATSNWDGRGDAGAQDDRILRLLSR